MNHISTLAASGGWDDLSNMWTSLNGRLMGFGILALGSIAVWVAIKMGGGKSLRESIGATGKLGLAGILLGMATMLPGLLSGIGGDIGGAAGGGDVPSINQDVTGQ